MKIIQYLKSKLSKNKPVDVSVHDTPNGFPPVNNDGVTYGRVYTPPNGTEILENIIKNSRYRISLSDRNTGWKYGDYNQDFFLVSLNPKEVFNNRNSDTDYGHSGYNPYPIIKVGESEEESTPIIECELLIRTRRKSRSVGISVDSIYVTRKLDNFIYPHFEEIKRLKYYIDDNVGGVCPSGEIRLKNVSFGKIPIRDYSNEENAWSHEEKQWGPQREVEIKSIQDFELFISQIPIREMTIKDFKKEIELSKLKRVYDEKISVFNETITTDVITDHFISVSDHFESSLEEKAYRNDINESQPFYKLSFLVDKKDTFDKIDIFNININDKNSESLFELIESINRFKNYFGHICDINLQFNGRLIILTFNMRL